MSVPAASSLNELCFLLLFFCKNLVMQSFTVSKVILVITVNNGVLWFETATNVWVNTGNCFALHEFVFCTFFTRYFLFC